MSAKKFILTTFLTLVFFNLARAIGSRIFAQTEFWRSMLNDQWHHYQLGILLLFIIPLILRKKKVVRDFILAIGSGMIIDESMYIFTPSTKTLAIIQLSELFLSSCSLQFFLYLFLN